MEQNEIIRFFDRCAPKWDAWQLRDQEKLDAILDAAGIAPGVSVLDVGCGTGFLFPDYLARGAAVTGVDLSPAMAARAGAREQGRVPVLCGDAAALDYGRTFQRIMVFNALPHFEDPAALAAHLARFLTPGGRLTIAHDMGRAALNTHHAGTAGSVSHPLPPAAEVAALLDAYVAVDTALDGPDRYVVSGVKRGLEAG